MGRTVIVAAAVVVGVDVDQSGDPIQRDLGAPSWMAQVLVVPVAVDAQRNPASAYPRS